MERSLRDVFQSQHFLVCALLRHVSDKIGHNIKNRPRGCLHCCTYVRTVIKLSTPRFPNLQAVVTKQANNNRVDSLEPVLGTRTRLWRRLKVKPPAAIASATHQVRYKDQRLLTREDTSGDVGESPVDAQTRLLAPASDAPPVPRAHVPQVRWAQQHGQFV